MLPLLQADYQTIRAAQRVRGVREARGALHAVGALPALRPPSADGLGATGRACRPGHGRPGLRGACPAQLSRAHDRRPRRLALPGRGRVLVVAVVVVALWLAGVARFTVG